MRKSRKRFLALCMAAVLSMGLLTVTALAGENVKEKELGQTEAATALMDAEKEEKQVLPDKPYAEGEALVVYKNQTAKIQSKEPSGAGMDLFGEGISIEDTWTFSDTDTAFGLEDVPGETAGGTSLDFSPVRVSKVSSGRYSTLELIKRLEQSGTVEYAQPNYYYKPATNDPYYSYQYSMENTGQMNGTEGVDLNTGNISVSGKKEVVVAVVDSGIDYTHEDLAGRMWKNPYENNLAGTCGIDTGDGDDDPMDVLSHGTHVAGIIAAESENQKGITGVAGSANVKLMAVKVFSGNGFATTESLIKGYLYIYEAVKLGVNVKVINCSLGGDCQDNLSLTVMDLLGEKGVLTVTAAGNDHYNLDNEPSYPALEKSAYNINVTASDQKGHLSDYGNYGSQSVDLAAPGSNILSCVPDLYASFEPSLYTDIQKGKEEGNTENPVYCHVYYDFAEETIPERFHAMPVQGSKGKTTVSPSSEEYFGNGDKNSIKWTVTGAKEEDYYMLAFPYYSEGNEYEIYQSAKLMLKNSSNNTNNATELAVYHVFLKEDGSVDYGRRIQKLGGLGVQKEEDGWATLSVSASTEAEEGEACAFIYQLEVKENADFTVYLDDFGISTHDLPEEALLPYQFYSGTSMAAPAVSGAIALLSASQPDKGALELKADLLSSVTKNEALEGKVKTGGILDLGKTGEKIPYIASAGLTAKKELVLTGNNFTRTGMSLYINGQKLKIKSAGKNKITADGEKYQNKRVTIILKTPNGQETYRRQYLSGGEELVSIAQMAGVNLPGTTKLASDGKNLYTLSADGLLSVYHQGSFICKCNVNGENNFKNNPEYQIGSYTVSPGNEFVYARGKFYTIFDITTEYTRETILASYDRKKKCWVREKNLPYGYRQNEIEAYTLAAFGGKLYLIGGVDEKKGLLTDVAEYNIKKKTWNLEEEKNLPVGMAGASAAEAGGKLYVYGGYVEGTPQLYSFDGEKWEKEGKQLDLLSKTENVYLKLVDGTVKNLQLYNTALAGDGKRLLITGNTAEGYGDIFYYNTQKESFISSAYTLKGNSLQNQSMSACFLDGNPYILGSKYWEEESISAGESGFILEESLYQVPLK